MRVVTAAEMREIDRRASEEFGIPSLQLMERAGAALAEAVPEVETVVVFCGPGNNGGDGLCAARILSERCEVEVFLTVDPSQLKGDAQTQFRSLAEKRVPIHCPKDSGYRRARERAAECDVLIDALLGFGARGEPQGEIARLVDAAHDAAHIVAADIPTGIDCDTGVASGDYILADQTVTFGLAKPFLFANEGLEASGQWQVADLGYPDELLESAGSAEILDVLAIAQGMPYRRPTAHKRTSGVVLVVAGSDSFPGALSLTCRGAARAGAGLVLGASVPSALDGLRVTLPECPHVILPEDGGWIAEAAAEVVAQAADRVDTVVIGPGLGRTAPVRAFLARLFELGERQWVLDADALYLLPELDSRPRGSVVLTPHHGEAGRLLDRPWAEVAMQRFESVREIAEQYDAVCVLKGPYSLIAAKDSDLYVNPTGNSLLATGGTGDVLAGVIGAIVSVKGDPLLAACTGAYWHGLAADQILEEEGVGVGWLASEVADALPSAYAAIRRGLFDEFVGGDDTDEEGDDDAFEWDDADFPSRS